MNAGEEFRTEPHYRGGRRNYATAPFDFDFDATYKEVGGAGIAWRAYAYQTEPTEDTEWDGIEIPTGKVLAHMVGDDREHEFDPDELQLIDEEAYCPGCGQIGCGWH
jgi:hypothetical protein